MSRTRSLSVAAPALTLTLALALTLTLAISCGGGEQTSLSLPEGTPVVLVSIDTLRSDRLPAYGYQGVETPALDALRQDAILYERAYSHSPLTLPSHASLLTGLLPPDHAVRDNLGYHLNPDRVPYLPRILGERGYRTGGVVSAYVLRKAVGLGAGFEHYDDEIRFQSRRGLGTLQRPGEETLERSVEWLRTVKEEPFFLFFHIYEPHTPYEPPEPFASRYDSPYDGEIAAADRIVGELFDALREMGAYDRALIVLLSDHGEGLGDHGEQEHGLLLYRESLQVPLMVKLPGATRGGESVSRPVQLVDVAPTVLDLLGIPRPDGLAGASLLTDPADDAPERAIYSETFYPRLHFGWSDLASVIQGRHHFIHGPDPELFDMVSDPAERNDVLRDERRAYAAARDALAEIDRELQPPEAVDESVRKELAALGYVGSVAGAAEGPLPDPKSRLPVLADLRDAFESYAAGDFSSAVDLFGAVVAEEPRLLDAWEHLALSLQSLGRLDEALDAFREALDLSGGAPHIALPTAALLLQMERPAEAARHARLALPVHESAYDLLAQASLAQGDLEEAEDQVQQALATRGTRIGPFITLAQLRLRQERWADAVEAADRAEEAFGDRTDTEVLHGLFFVRGQAHARLGEVEAAERDFRREIELFPGNLGPYSHLSVLYAVAGLSAQTSAVLRAMVERNPVPSAYAEAVRTIRTLGDGNAAAALLREALRRWPESQELRELAG